MLKTMVSVMRQRRHYLTGSKDYADGVDLESIILEIQKQYLDPTIGDFKFFQNRKV